MLRPLSTSFTFRPAHYTIIRRMGFRSAEVTAGIALTSSSPGSPVHSTIIPLRDRNIHVRSEDVLDADSGDEHRLSGILSTVRRIIDKFPHENKAEIDVHLSFPTYFDLNTVHSAFQKEFRRVSACHHGAFMKEPFIYDSIDSPVNELLLVVGRDFTTAQLGPVTRLGPGGHRFDSGRGFSLHKKWGFESSTNNVVRHILDSIDLLCRDPSSAGPDLKRVCFSYFASETMLVKQSISSLRSRINSSVELFAVCGPDVQLALYQSEIATYYRNNPTITRSPFRVGIRLDGCIHPLIPRNILLPQVFTSTFTAMGKKAVVRIVLAGDRKDVGAFEVGSIHLDNLHVGSTVEITIRADVSGEGMVTVVGWDGLGEESSARILAEKTVSIVPCGVTMAEELAIMKTEELVPTISYADYHSSSDHLFSDSLRFGADLRLQTRRTVVPRLPEI